MITRSELSNRIYPNQIRKLSAVDRFWLYVKENKNGCWDWTGKINKVTGYGSLGVNHKTYYSHRISWVIFYGDLDDNILVLHHCDNPKCVNPKHLFLGTHKDNTRDSIKKGRCKIKGAERCEYDTYFYHLKRLNEWTWIDNCEL